MLLESAQLLGRPLEIPVRHLDAVLLAAIEEGRLPVEPTTASVTYHDPCKFTRLAGLGEMGRSLLGRVAGKVVEMEPHGAHNLCCNDGSGPLRLTGLQDLRRRVSQPKLEQLRATGAERVVTPCAVCMLTLRDLCGASGLAMRSMMMFELVQEAATAALGAGNPRFARAVALEGLPEPERPAHRLEGYLDRAMAQGDLAKHLGALGQDPAVQSLCRRDPGASRFLSGWISRLGGVR